MRGIYRPAILKYKIQMEKSIGWETSPQFIIIFEYFQLSTVDHEFNQWC